jgi:hypothetical protein
MARAAFAESGGSGVAGGPAPSPPKPVAHLAGGGDDLGLRIYLAQPASANPQRL